MGFLEGYVKKYNDGQVDFSHDFVEWKFNYSILCTTCKKEFDRKDLESIDKTAIRTCFVKYNKWLEEQREKKMIEMLGKYFCIWKV